MRSIATCSLFVSMDDLSSLGIILKSPGAERGLFSLYRKLINSKLCRLGIHSLGLPSSLLSTDVTIWVLLSSQYVLVNKNVL